MSWHMRREWNLLNYLFLAVQLLRFAMVSLCDSQYRPEHLSIHRQGCISAANSKTPSFKYGWDLSCSFSDTPRSTSPGHAHPPTHTMPQIQPPQAGEQEGMRLCRSCLWATKIPKKQSGCSALFMCREEKVRMLMTCCFRTKMTLLWVGFPLRSYIPSSHPSPCKYKITCKPISAECVPSNHI